MKRALLLLLIAGCKRDAAPITAVAPSATTSAAPTRVEPWEPANPAFKGCEGG